MGTMWSVSDIPDWCFVEGGLTFDPATPPTNEQLGLLQSKSPIVHVDKVPLTFDPTHHAYTPPITGQENWTRKHTQFWMSAKQLDIAA